MRGLRVALVLIVVVSGTILPGAARAAFPGQNGKLAFSSDASGAQEVYTVEPNGSGLTRLTFGGGASPAWSADGTKIAFTRAGAVWVMNADGTDQHSLGQPGSQPAWSPDGTRIVTSGLSVMNADGTGRTQIAPSGFSPVWSPDGSTILFVRLVLDSSGQRSRIFMINPDGSGERQITDDVSFEEGWNDESQPNWEPRRRAGDGTTFPAMRYVMLRRHRNDICECDALEILEVGSSSETLVFFETPAQPAWSPDGTRIVFNDTASEDLAIHNVATGSTSYVTASFSVEADPDWQPLPVNTPSTYARPKSANPVRVSLVPAYRECSAPNREHGPPLAFGSCAPPTPGSSHLMVGVGDGHPSFARSVGFARLKVTTGVPGGEDDTTGRLRVSITNVMRASDLSEYTGELRGSVRVRITDTQGAVAQTVQDLPLELTVPCLPTPEAPGMASVCELGTDLDAVLPGATPEGTRAIWQLDQVKVHDGGPDEDADTAGDNELFAVQGIFIP